MPSLKQEHGTFGLSAFVQIRSAIHSGPGVILEGADRLLVTQNGLGDPPRTGALYIANISNLFSDSEKTRAIGGSSKCD